MNILFLTLDQFNSLNERGIYTDLLRAFIKRGHKVFAISPIEKKQNQSTHMEEEKNAHILRLQIGNIQKTNVIEKGISTLLIEYQYKTAIKRYFSNTKFDLVLYSTPPITLVGAIEYVKKRDNARTYLLLKDIFPQNAVDIGMMSKKGLKGLLYSHFRKQEKKLYAVSDRIGCMSQANVDYILRNNIEVKQRNDSSIKNTGKEIVEICPNCIEPIDMSISEEERYSLRERYHIPQDKLVFVYGGNLGKPQGIPFMLKCLDSQKDNKRVFFLIIGGGTEYHLIEEYINGNRPKNVLLYQMLSKDDYERLVAACDVGMIFLDHRFTIPNFPSRLLSYMQAKLPVLVVTDVNTDIRNAVTGIDRSGKKTHDSFGLWCESNDINGFIHSVKSFVELNTNRYEMGNNGYAFLEEKYDVDKCVDDLTI